MERVETDCLTKERIADKPYISSDGRASVLKTECRRFNSCVYMKRGAGRESGTPTPKEIRMKCEATTNPTLWWHGKDKIDFPQCSRQASLNIDGLNLCAQHAGTIAIQKLVSRGEIKRIKDTPQLCQIEDRWKEYMR